MKSFTAEVNAADGVGNTLAELAYQSLMAMLLSGELAPNEVVAERQIAMRLGVSRTPLREAIRRLEGERFLERQRSGALVARPLPVDEFMHILSVRRVLEAESARLAAGNMPKAELQSIRDRIVELRNLPADHPMPPEFAQSDRDLHLMIAAASGNPVLQQMIENLRKRTAMFRFSRMPSRRVTVCDEHLAIIDALASGEGKTAQHVMEQHIGEVRSSILERLRAR